MPRPITKEDIKKGRKENGWGGWPDVWKVRKDKTLGIYLYDPSDRTFTYACEVYLHRHNRPRWITKETFKRKQKRGHSKPCKKHIRQIMREPDFGLDEMAIAEAIINETT